MPPNVERGVRSLKWGALFVSLELRYLFLLPALAPLLYYCLAIFSSWDYFAHIRRLRPATPEKLPPVSILKPVCGVERELYENFASMCRLDYPEFEIVFAVEDPNDPVVALIDKLQREFPETPIRLITKVQPLGSSPKTNSLCALVKEAKYELLVINDSDIRVEKDYLRDVLLAFSDPKVGLVTTLFRGRTGQSLAERLDAIGIPSETAASMLLERKFSRIDFAYGWTMAISKPILRELGGFEAMVNLHSDDFTVGNEVAKRGYRVELLKTPVWMVFPSETIRDFLKHELRWSVQLKNLRPVGYLGIFLTFGLGWSFLVALLAPSWKTVGAYVLAYLILRLTLAWVVGVWGLRDPVVRRNLWLVPLRDAVNLGLYVVSFFSNRTEWCGARYRVSGPTMIPLGQPK